MTVLLIGDSITDAGRDREAFGDLGGVNDMWRRYDDDDPTSVEDFEANYRKLLERLGGTAALILVEPFLLPVREEQWSWRADLDPKIQVVRRLAYEFGATLVPADG